MLDQEFLKLAIQSGSFGLNVVIVWWMLFRGAPMIREAFAKIQEECRQERAELAAIHAAEREMDRKARHDQAALFQRMIVEMQRYYDRKPPDGGHHP